MKIHFVCSGNTFRSRLAEAYLRSKQITGLEVSSSGIKAHDNKNGPVTWFGARLMKRYGLVPHMSKYWKRTTPKLLEQADTVIFMDKAHHHHSKTDLGFTGKRYEIWNIPDLENLGFDTETGSDIEEDVKRIVATEKIFSQIKRKVDSLIKTL